MYPKDMSLALCFIHRINELAAIILPNYSLQADFISPHFIEENGSFIIPLSGYCCYLSTRINKYFLQKYYPINQIEVKEGLYKGIGDHSWLEVVWKDKQYVIDTKPYDQGFPNIYNFGTPFSDRKYRYFLEGEIKYKHEEYHNREDLSRYIISVLDRIIIQPLKLRKRRWLMDTNYMKYLIDYRKKEYNLMKGKKYEM